MQMGDNNDIPDWIPCPSCGCEAYWDGAVYFCDQCGWSGDVDVNLTYFCIINYQV